MSVRDPLALAERYAPSTLLLLVGLFMFWVRTIPSERVITETAVYFSGNDPWYHNRMVHLAVRHFPQTTPFDPWSYFPYGTGHHSGFGGLFDQLIALGALIVGLGNPSPHLVDVVTAYAPAVFGALTAVPTYILAKRLTDRWGGVAAAVLLALSGGGLLARTVVGVADHQSAEALFGSLALVGFAYALAVAYSESPMVEDVMDRNWGFLRTPVVAGIAGGVAIASYLMLWPPGVMVLFTFGVFVVVQFSREHYAGKPTDHLAIATVIPMITAGCLTLLYARTFSLESTAFSLLQPLVAFGLAGGTVLLVCLSRYAEREGYDREYYPPAVAALILAALALAWLVYPRAIDMLRQLFVRTYSFGYFTSVTAGTVAEIQPPSLNQVFAAYGMVLLLALLGALLLAYRAWRDDRPTNLLILFWCFSMFSAYFTMARFGYYFSVVVAVLGAFGIWWIVTRWIALDIDLANIRQTDVGMYQVFALLVIVILIVPGNVVAVGGQAPAWETAPRLSGTDQAWYDGLNWLQDNSPDIPLEYYEAYQPPADSDYDYPQAAYGVASWWDYGHWITVMGHRIPYANPFQQNPRPMSAYFQATNETRANLILEALPSLSENPGQVASMSTEELRSVAAEQSAEIDDENGRYVAIDDQMLGGKFVPITRWAGPGTTTYFQSSQYQLQGRQVSLTTTTQPYEETLLARLYYQDAGGLEHYRLVHEVDQYAIVGGRITGQRVIPLDSLTVGSNWSAIQPIANTIAQSRRAGRLVSLGQGTNQYVYNARVESRVKLYEKVEGATLTGTVPNATNRTTVIAHVRLQTHTGRTFTYLQQTRPGPDGTFSMTVPYATNDAVTVAEGGTNSSVSAMGQYQVQVGTGASLSASGTVAVPEEAIYEGREIQVELEPVQRENESTTGNTSNTSGDLAVIGEFGAASDVVTLGNPMISLPSATR